MGTELRDKDHKITVKFPKGKWSFKPKRLKKANVEEGTWVHWTSSDDDIPKGSIGTVVQLRSDGLIDVEFPKGKWKFKYSQLARTQFQKGSLVTWTSSDDDLPQGTIGKVMTWSADGKVRVRFPKGSWNFALKSLQGVSGNSAPWKDTVQQINAKAHAYVATVLRRMGEHKVPTKVKRWFGSNDKRTRKEVRRVLNSITKVLMNVAYVYPGETCGNKTYAYVYKNTPGMTRNARGQYLFYLCDITFKKVNEMIEVLTHEASHHHPGKTDDVCLRGSGDDCDMAYGRSDCKKLAKKSNSKALKNADNYCYFISDAFK